MNKIIKTLIYVFISFSFSMNIFAYEKAPVDITEMNIYEIQDAIDNGYLTYELLVKLYLDRIEAYDDDHNAIITLNKDAIKQAIELDKEYKETGRRSILFGIPIVVKDNIDVKGMPTTAGSKALAKSYPNNNSKIAQNLIDAGAIIIAKSNMSEFAFMASSSSSSYGTVKNAYNILYSSYGSSGGSAVAVALQYAPLALGTDTNSSLRAPASANSVIGFRPTLGLVSTNGIIAYDITKDTAGPLAKTAKESASLLEVIADKEEGSYTNNLETSSLKGKKIAVLTQFLYGDSSVSGNGLGTPNKEIKTLMENAIKKLKDAGAEVIEIDNFYKSKYFTVYNSTLGGWTMCHAFNEYIKNTSSTIDSFYDLNYASGKTVSLWDYVSDCGRNINGIEKYTATKKEYKNYVNSLFEDDKIDALIYPTTKNKLLKVNTTGLESNSYAIAPVLGLPAVSVPLGYDSDKLPYGIEFVGAANDEKNLYEIIYSFEQINNVYELPSIAPPLYEVPESVKKLMNLYEEKEITLKDFVSKNIKEDYENTKKEIEDFFKNYNDYEDQDSAATTLYVNYSNAIKAYENSFSLFKPIVITIGVLLFLIVIRIIKIKIRRKRKKKRNK